MTQPAPAGTKASSNSCNEWTSHEHHERAELDAALAAAVARDGPAMVEVITDPNLV